MSTGALITGNTVVFKPASDTPYMGLKLYEILHEAGLPPGVFNYVTGPGATVGQELVDNTEVDGFVFTGSRSIGMKAYAAFSHDRPKPIIAEMGGKNPTIVTSNADLDKAALGVMRAAFGYGGQKCSACSRVLVDKRVKQAFLQKLVAETQKIKIGDPIQRDVYLGPVINEAAVSKYEEAIAEIQRSKGRILAGGKALKGTGLFVEPAIVDGLPRNHRINKEELFVPVLSVVEVDDLEDARAVRGEALLRRGASGRGVREPHRGCDDRRRRRRPAVRRMEDVGHHRQSGRRPLLPRAVPARAEPDGVRGLSGSRPKPAHSLQEPMES
jgi:1-pyrroline-5-carboxylate dehydrogenase